MRAGETELEMVTRHVTQGEGHIAKQRALIDRLKLIGLPTVQSEVMLGLFMDVQDLHRQHLARLQDRAPMGAALDRGTRSVD